MNMRCRCRCGKEGKGNSLKVDILGNKYEWTGLCESCITGLVSLFKSMLELKKKGLSREEVIKKTFGCSVQDFEQILEKNKQ